MEGDRSDETAVAKYGDGQMLCSWPPYPIMSQLDWSKALPDSAVKRLVIDAFFEHAPVVLLVAEPPRTQHALVD